jgi:hypothetical protein
MEVSSGVRDAQVAVKDGLSVVAARTAATFDHRTDTLAKATYNKSLTALLVIDPYNDFISEGGKVWDSLGQNV